MLSRRWLLPILAALTLLSLPAILLGLAVMLAYPTLPSLEALTDYRPKIPLRVYSAEGALLGEFGEERRALVKISEVPDVMKKAILAAEDDRFYEHGGVDYMGVLRAAISNFTAGGAKQGASTITMQVARNFFLSKEKTMTRKFNEVLLAFKIEHNLSKDEILQLYFNQIYLGQRAYGFAAASQVYFGKPLGQVTLAEAAMLAGLPKAPSSYNPVVNPKRAKLRQAYVLRRMHELHFIDDEQLRLAQQQPITAKHGTQEYGTKSDYIAEMARQAVYEKYHEDTYALGFKVYTTIRQQEQLAAYQAVRAGVLEYDRRHGYRGPEGFIDPKKGSGEEYLEEALQEVADNDDLIPAVVQEASPKLVRAYCKGGEVAEVSGEALQFAQRALNGKVALNQRIIPGSVIRLQKDEKGVWQISQLPQVEAAFVSADPRDGAIHALVGGFNFGRNQFNRITQAWRQPGSSLKPFIYSAALEKGFTPATVINDAPLMFDAEQTGSEPWQPKNFDNEYAGPMRMRRALTKSKNLVSIRILQSITPQYAQDYLTKFGFDADKHPPYLTMALGAGSVTPMQMLTGYSTFANGGFRVTPYFIERIEDAQGKVLLKTRPVTAGEDAEQVIDVRNAYTMISMMQDVVKHGTAIRAMQLGRQDLAGKTGTTSDSIDAWFCGFQPTLVGIAWMGFDQPRSLGDKETGGGAALPIWMSYMEKALKDVPQAEYAMPDNMTVVRINEAGYRDPNGSLFESFYQENIPPEQAMPPPAPSGEARPVDTVKDQLL
ncbi:penicillin-binding protein 1A [Candidatus Ferrigenium straubiae]|jgi:penicillin-binding protein 1A|uniref:penicillin-binding protein 1A n=1 Tax=Candidatus Ferrigenium straubiae TaxID=2919506 RepID=UPI003F4AC422